MLSTNERSGLKDILSDIDDRDLFSILETVTKRMFTTHNRQVATEKILTCTGKPSDLLRRQKVTKKILFNYLVKRRIPVLAEYDKAAMVKKCLEFWGSTEMCKDSDYVEDIQENNHLAAVTQMGFEFSKWFFPMLNTLSGFGPEHFWPACKLSAELWTPEDNKEVSLFGAPNVTAFLVNLIQVDKYYFHANESKDSVKLEMEEHGLVKVLIRGVLHQHSNCVGLFDVAFGLVKNPECSDNYKIQLMKVKMQVNIPVQRGLPVNNYPSICQLVQ